MKNIIFVIGSILLLTSCNEDLEDYNVDPKNPESVDAAYLFSYAQYNLAKQFGDIDYSNNVGRIWANYTTQTTYIQESQYDASNRDIGGSLFDNIYTENLYELKTAKETLRSDDVSEAEEPIRDNKIALIKILEVFSYQYLVDNLGDVPFTEALDINNASPAYDDSEYIYGAIADSLSNAITLLDVSSTSFGDNDLIYYDDLTKWKKFAHSLQLKLGIRLSKYDSTKAQELISAAVAGGVFDSNDDNPEFVYSGTQPYVNPVYDYFVVDSRNTDFVATENFLELLTGLNDTRVNVFYDDNLNTVDEDGEEVVNPMVGGVFGATGNAYTTLTHLNPDFTDDSVYPTTLMEYSTVCFEMAEAIERGLATGSAEDYYNNGVTASFDALGLSSDAAAYLIANPYDSSNFEESIGIQKYISLFHNGHEAWTESRRLGYPVLATAASNGVENPKRVIYPSDEPLINAENYNEASSNMGGDLATSPIFWDVD